MPKHLTVDYMKCTGCRICEMSCAYKHYGTSNTEFSKIKVHNFFPGIDIPNFCFKCSDAPCISGCPFNALSKNEDECIEVDIEKCTGCGLCVKKCRAKVINLHPNQKYPMICNDCGKSEPECAKNCPTKALDYVTLPFDGKYLANVPEEICSELSKNLYSDVSFEETKIIKKGE